MNSTRCTRKTRRRSAAGGLCPIRIFRVKPEYYAARPFRAGGECIRPGVAVRYAVQLKKINYHPTQLQCRAALLAAKGLPFGAGSVWRNTVQSVENSAPFKRLSLAACTVPASVRTARPGNDTDAPGNDTDAPGNDTDAAGQCTDACDSRHGCLGELHGCTRRSTRSLRGMTRLLGGMTRVPGGVTRRHTTVDTDAPGNCTEAYDS